MWKYYKRIFGRFRQDFRMSLGEQMIGFLLATAILLLQIRWGVIHPTDVRASSWAVAWPYLALAAGLFLWHLIRVPYAMDREKQETETDLRQKLASLQDDFEQREPRLGLGVHEVILIPNLDTVDVFLDAEISNQTFGTQATIRQYEFGLERGGTTYKTTPEIRDLARWQVFSVYEVVEDNQLIEERSEYQELNDLAREINYIYPLVHGVSRRGWLHFRVEQMPLWPHVEKPTGGESGNTDRQMKRATKPPESG